MALTIILIMAAFGLIIHIDECKERGTKSIVDKLGDWWILKMKSKRTGWIVWFVIFVIAYFLIKIIM